MSIYLVIVAATLLLGAVMPQKGRKRIWYILLMTAIHAFVCAFRYEHLTGDLMKYHNSFNHLAECGWFSDEVLQDGKNTGFMLLMKLINELTGGDFQMLLIIVAVITHVILGYMVWKYSTAPWMSFLAWNCMALYIFGFSAIKQALAMAFVMLSFVGIARKNLLFYAVMLAIAGFIHTPAFVFIPAYWLAQMRVKPHVIVFYVLLGILLYIFKDQFVDFISAFYYDEDEAFAFSGEIGNRFIMLLGFTLFGVVFCGFSDPNYEKLFHLMAIATILQMLAGFDNIFTRMADYYFQFSVLYIPMTFVSGKRVLQHSAIKTILPFNKRSMRVLTAAIAIFMVWYYYTYAINVSIDFEVDNYLNYRFMWDLRS